MGHRRTHARLALLCAVSVAALLTGLVPFTARLRAAGAQPPGATQSNDVSWLTQEIAFTPSTVLEEIRVALVRLPLAALLGAALALRPRRRNQGRRSVLVVQTQIMLAVVGAVIMLVVGNSISRAFGIVGAAGLVRYRSTIDDPKEAVVMLCALGAGLAAGVGQYTLATFATVFMATVLLVVEYFEPSARKAFELKVRTKNAPAFRPKLEGVLFGFRLDVELLSESEEELGYSVNTPIDVRTRDISDTLRLLSGDDEMAIEWDEKRLRR